MLELYSTGINNKFLTKEENLENMDRVLAHNPNRLYLCRCNAGHTFVSKLYKWTNYGPDKISFYVANRVKQRSVKVENLTECYIIGEKE